MCLLTEYVCVFTPYTMYSMYGIKTYVGVCVYICMRMRVRVCV